MRAPVDMLSAISSYVGFTAAGLVLAILAVDRHLRVSRARATVALRVVPVAADATQRRPVIMAARSGAGHVKPPLPPATFRRPPVPPQRPLRPSFRAPDQPATPRGEARLTTPWGDLTRLPASPEQGIVPSTLAAPAAASYLPAT